MPSDGALETKETLNQQVLTLNTPLTNAPPHAGAMELTAVDGLADVASFRELADMLFMPSQVLQPHERAYLIDMIKVALPALAGQERLNFAQRLAKMGDSAKALLPVLSSDADLEVASAILSSNITLADDALVELIQSAEPERLMLIARRPDLSTAVTAAILYTEDVPAIGQALKNPKARFSPQILAECTELAGDYAILRTPLMQRAEISPAIALDLFWMLGHKGRADILYRHLADDQYLNKTSISKSSAAMRQRDSQTAPVATTGASELEQLNAFISIGEIEKAIPVLVRAAGLRGVLARQILSDPGGEPLAVLYKHAGARRADFQDLCDRTRHLGLSHLAQKADFEALSVLFDRLSRGQAHMAITYWDWRAAGIGPYASKAGEPASMKRERERASKTAAKPALHIHEVKTPQPTEEKSDKPATSGKPAFGKRMQPSSLAEPQKVTVVEKHVEPIIAVSDEQPETTSVQEMEKPAAQVIQSVILEENIASQQPDVLPVLEIQDYSKQRTQTGDEGGHGPLMQTQHEDVEDEFEFREKPDSPDPQTEDDEFEFREKKQDADSDVAPETRPEPEPAPEPEPRQPEPEPEVLDFTRSSLPRLGRSRGYLSDID